MVWTRHHLCGVANRTVGAIGCQVINGLNVDWVLSMIINFERRSGFKRQALVENVDRCNASMATTG
jgi:hypothetical protein